MSVFVIESPKPIPTQPFDYDITTKVIKSLAISYYI
jgi:hypothetical protein